MTVMRVAVLLKQVPKPDFSELELDGEGRLNRSRVPAEMNPWCRRALAAGVKLARENDGSCMVFTMGPPAAEALVREAIAYGADEGVLITDPALAGSDTLITATALARALENYTPFDLILTGKASTDSDTGQVGPAVAELLDLPFLPAVRQMELDGKSIRTRCETDDGWLEAATTLPAVVACAERLTAPARASEQERLDAVDASLIHLLDADRLGPGPWGQEGSPTVVGRVRVMDIRRQGIVLSGTPHEQAASAARYLDERGVLDRVNRDSPPNAPAPNALGEPAARPITLQAGTVYGTQSASMPAAAPSERSGQAAGVRPDAGIAVLMEPGLDHVNRELAQIAIRIAADLGAAWVAILFGNHLDSTAANTASTASTARLVEAVGADTPEDMASAVVSWLQSNNAGVLLAPSTTYGREVAARVGAATSSGVAGDAIGIGVSDGSVFALKPALGGSLVAEICFKSPLRIVTVRPGAMPASRMARSALADASSGMTPSAAAPSQMPATGTGEPMIERVAAAVRQRVTVSQQVREVDIGKVLSAGRLVCIGAGVDPSLYKLLDPLVELLGAQQVATRKVTDKGHLPRALQVGITGINVSPDLYLAIGVQGKPNHMAGVHGAGTVVSMNIDPDAVVFGQSDIGMVGDWQELVPALHDALKGFIRRLPPN